MAPSKTSSTPVTMRAWKYDSARAGIENSMYLINENIPPSLLSPKGDRGLIEVLSMALNPGPDFKMPESGLLSRLTPKPASPGIDFCGRLVEGDRRLVFGRLDWVYQHGTLGQFILAKPGDFVDVPKGLDVNEAAALPTAAISAYQSIVPYVKTGDRVFVNGGSGGVGTCSIQIAKALGCYVVASCSARNEVLCKQIGADEIIDYTKGNLAEALARMDNFDLVVDNVGHDQHLHRKSETFLKSTGSFVLIGAMLDDLGGMLSMLDSWLRPAWLGGPRRRWKYIMTQNNPAHLQRIADWTAEGKLKAVVDEVFAYEDAPKAIAKLKTGRARGKVVVSGASS